MKNIKFGTGGFRGIISDDFTKENVEKICLSIVNIINKEKLKKEICIGYDNRFLSENFAYWCASVFADNDFKVNLMQNATSTPVVMYKTMQNKLDYGVMITASHNPYIYNGIKIFTQLGKDASLEVTKQIEEEFSKISEIKFKKSEKERNNNIKYINVVEEFVDYIIKNQNINDCSNLKVVFDTKFGSTKEEIELFCKKINLKNYSIINANRDAFFNFVTPAPSEDNIEQLKLNVLSSNADIGFSLDADGDRLAVVDSFGNYLDNNIILSLIYYYLVKYENLKGDLVKNVCTTSLVNILAKKFGYNTHEVPVGFKYISSKVIETNAIIGGESSGGLMVKNHIYGKDSLLSIALILKILSSLNKPFNKIIEELLAFANNFNKKVCDKQYSYNLEKEKEIKEKLFIKKILPKFNYKPIKIEYKDYLKIFYENNNWTVVRFSGTEPLIRIFCEFENIELCNKEIKLWEDFLNLK